MSQSEFKIYLINKISSKPPEYETYIINPGDSTYEALKTTENKYPTLLKEECVLSFNEQIISSYSKNYENLKRKKRQRSKSIFSQGRLSNDKYFLDKYKINLMKFQLKIYFI